MYTLAYGGDPWIWAIIAIAVVVLFGANKIPEMMKGLGSGMKEFKKGMKDEEDPELQREKDKEAEIRRRVEEEMRRENAK